VQRERHHHEREQKKTEQDARHQLYRRKGEHVVADVAPEYRIGNPKRRRVKRLKQRSPLAGRAERNEQREERRSRQSQPVRTARHERLHRISQLVARPHLRHGRPHPVRCFSQRKARIAEEDDECDQRRRHRERPLCHDLRQEDPLEPDLAIPEPIRQAARQEWHEAQHDHDQRDENDCETRHRNTATAAMRTKRSDPGIAEPANDRVVVGRHALGHRLSSESGMAQ